MSFAKQRSFCLAINVLNAHKICPLSVIGDLTHVWRNMVGPMDKDFLTTIHL